jgi:predicted HTH transcriptional regulator
MNTLEFKEAKIQYDMKKLCRYCVAIGNEGGGKVILGVSRTVPRSVVGTKAFQNLNDVKSQCKICAVLGLTFHLVANPNQPIQFEQNP